MVLPPGVRADRLASWSDSQGCFCEGKTLEHFAANLHILEQCKPVYQHFKGWDDDISEVKNLQL